MYMGRKQKLHICGEGPNSRGFESKNEYAIQPPLVVNAETGSGKTQVIIANFILKRINYERRKATLQRYFLGTLGGCRYSGHQFQAKCHSFIQFQLNYYNYLYKFQRHILLRKQLYLLQIAMEVTFTEEQVLLIANVMDELTGEFDFTLNKIGKCPKLLYVHGTSRGPEIETLLKKFPIGLRIHRKDGRIHYSGYKQKDLRDAKHKLLTHKQDLETMFAPYLDKVDICLMPVYQLIDGCGFGHRLQHYPSEAYTHIIERRNATIEDVLFDVTGIGAKAVSVGLVPHLIYTLWGPLAHLKGLCDLATYKDLLVECENLLQVLNVERSTSVYRDIHYTNYTFPTMDVATASTMEHFLQSTESKLSRVILSGKEDFFKKWREELVGVLIYLKHVSRGGNLTSCLRDPMFALNDFTHLSFDEQDMEGTSANFEHLLWICLQNIDPGGKTHAMSIQSKRKGCWKYEEYDIPAWATPISFLQGVKSKQATLWYYDSKERGSSEQITVTIANATERRTETTEWATTIITAHKTIPYISDNLKWLVEELSNNTNVANGFFYTCKVSGETLSLWELIDSKWYSFCDFYRSEMYLPVPCPSRCFESLYDKFTEDKEGNVALYADYWYRNVFCECVSNNISDYTFYGRNFEARTQFPAQVMDPVISDFAQKDVLLQGKSRSEVLSKFLQYFQRLHFGSTMLKPTMLEAMKMYGNFNIEEDECPTCHTFLLYVYSELVKESCMDYIRKNKENQNKYMEMKCLISRLNMALKAAVSEKYIAMQVQQLEGIANQLKWYSLPSDDLESIKGVCEKLVARSLSELPSELQSELPSELPSALQSLNQMVVQSLKQRKIVKRDPDDPFTENEKMFKDSTTRQIMSIHNQGPSGPIFVYNLKHHHTHGRGLPPFLDNSSVGTLRFLLTHASCISGDVIREVFSNQDLVKHISDSMVFAWRKVKVVTPKRTQLKVLVHKVKESVIKVKVSDQQEEQQEDQLPTVFVWPEHLSRGTNLIQDILEECTHTPNIKFGGAPTMIISMFGSLHNRLNPAETVKENLIQAKGRMSRLVQIHPGEIEKIELKFPGIHVVHEAWSHSSSAPEFFQTCVQKAEKFSEGVLHNCQKVPGGEVLGRPKSIIAKVNNTLISGSESDSTMDEVKRKIGNILYRRKSPSLTAPMNFADLPKDLRDKSKAIAFTQQMCDNARGLHHRKNEKRTYAGSEYAYPLLVDYMKRKRQREVTEITHHRNVKQKKGKNETT